MPPAVNTVGYNVVNDVTMHCPIKRLVAGTREFEDVRGKMESDSGESTGGIIDLSQLSKLSAGMTALVPHTAVTVLL